LNIPGITIKFIIKNGKNMAPQQTCQERAAHQKLTDQARRALIREATKRPKIILMELQSATAEIGVSVHRTTLSRTLHRAGLYRRVARKRNVGDSPNERKMVLWSDETKI
jgi:transposase